MTSIKAAAILVAAGQGERLASITGGTPKQFIRLSQIPLFIWSLKTLVKHPAIEEVLVTVPPDWFERSSKLITEFLPEFEPNISLVVGGNTRQQSVHLALEKFASANNQPNYIFVHDAVRPFISSSIIDQILKELEKGNSVTLGIPSSDSMKTFEQKIILEDLDRSKFVLVQTPQAAKFSLLLAAHRAAKLEQTQSTDDASIIKAYGADVTILSGNKLNFKITEPEDLTMAKALIEHNGWSAGNIAILT